MMGWSSRVLRITELSQTEIDLWSSFCNDDPSLAHPFSSFAFARAADRVRPNVFCAVLQKSGHTVGFLPFQFSNVVTRIARWGERSWWPS